MITTQDVKAAQRSGDPQEASRVAKAFYAQQQAASRVGREAARAERRTQEAAFRAAAHAMREQPHAHSWKQFSAEPDNASAGYGYLLKVRYYCTECEVVKIATQSASTCKWRDEITGRYACVDYTGELGETNAVIGY